MGYRSVPSGDRRVPRRDPQVSAIGPTAPENGAMWGFSAELWEGCEGRSNCRGHRPQNKLAKFLSATGSRLQKGSPWRVPIMLPHQASAAATRSSVPRPSPRGGNWLA